MIRIEILIYLWLLHGGSGVHRSEIHVLNTKAKEIIYVYDNCLSYIQPCSDLYIPDDVYVYSGNVEVIGDNYSNLSFSANEMVGMISLENGVPVFASSTEKLPLFSYDDFFEMYKYDPGFKTSRFLILKKLL